MLFVKSRHQYKQEPWIHIVKLLNVSIEQAKRVTKDQSSFAGRLCSATLWQQVYHLEDFNCTVLYPMYTFNPESYHHFALKHRILAFKKCMALLGTSYRKQTPCSQRRIIRQAIRPYNDILTR